MSAAPGGDGPRPSTERVRIRRAPRLGVFVLIGVIVGLVTSFVLSASFPADPSIGFWATAGYFAIYGVVGGALLGALVALVLDAVSRRRARHAEAIREPGVPVTASSEHASSDADSSEAPPAEPAAEARAAQESPATDLVDPGAAGRDTSHPTAPEEDA